MTEPSLPLGDSFLLSPRTANYIDALTKEGDKFDYSKWLQRVREGEAQAKQGLRKLLENEHYRYQALRQSSPHRLRPSLAVLQRHRHAGENGAHP
jgi:hypothetical protein